MRLNSFSGIGVRVLRALTVRMPFARRRCGGVEGRSLTRGAFRTTVGGFGHGASHVTRVTGPIVGRMCRVRKRVCRGVVVPVASNGHLCGVSIGLGTTCRARNGRVIGSFRGTVLLRAVSST